MAGRNLFVMKSTALVLVVMAVLECSAWTVFAAWPSHGSVSISNGIDAANQTLLVDCMKGTKHSHIFTPTQTPLAHKQQLGWTFTPDFFGRSKYDCDFEWLTHSRRLRVWEDTYWIRIVHWNTRYCTNCVWLVTGAGFWRMTSDLNEKTPVWSGGWTS